MSRPFLPSPVWRPLWTCQLLTSSILFLSVLLRLFQTTPVFFRFFLEVESWLLHKAKHETLLTFVEFLFLALNTAGELSAVLLSKILTFLAVALVIHILICFSQKRIRPVDVAVILLWLICTALLNSKTESYLSRTVQQSLLVTSSFILVLFCILARTRRFHPSRLHGKFFVSKISSAPLKHQSPSSPTPVGAAAGPSAVSEDEQAESSPKKSPSQAVGFLDTHLHNMSLGGPSFASQLQNRGRYSSWLDSTKPWSQKSQEDSSSDSSGRSSPSLQEQPQPARQRRPLVSPARLIAKTTTGSKSSPPEVNRRSTWSNSQDSPPTVSSSSRFVCDPSPSLTLIPQLTERLKEHQQVSNHSGPLTQQQQSFSRLLTFLLTVSVVVNIAFLVILFRPTIISARQ